MNKEPTTLLLKALIDAEGGVGPFSRKLGIDRQVPTYWLNQGYVPLTRIAEVVEKFSLHPWGLNYVQLKKMFGKSAPPWKEVVNSYNLDSKVASKILSSGSVK